MNRATILTEKELYSLDIRCSDKLHTYLSHDELFENAAAKIVNSFKNQWTPPIFLYHEKREERNELRSVAFYGGAGSVSLKSAYSSGRGMITGFELGGRMNQTTRGKVLNSFSKIEFCIDALMCIELGAFNDKVDLRTLKKETTGERAIFNSTSKKIQYLLMKGIINPKAAKSVRKAKKIRNSLAHNYLPIDDYGLEKSDLDLFGSHNLAISAVFNNAWFDLLVVYSSEQLKVLNWLENRKKLP